MEARLLAVDVCAWPVLTRLGPTRLGLVHFNRPSHGLEEGDLAALVSEDEGRTWHHGGLVAPHAPGTNRMHAAAGVDRDGRWVVLSTGFALRDGRHLDLEPVWCSTLDAGASASGWRVQREIGLQGTAARPVVHGRVLTLPDGRLAATVYRSHGRGQPSHAWLIVSADGGASWNALGRIGADDANEVSLLRRTDGRWLAAVRTHLDHHVAWHESTDEGATWHWRADLTLPMQHPGDLADLGERGLLLTYGIRNRGLMGIGARASRDGGATWSAPVVLHQFGDGATDCGYPSTVACADGSLLTACYADRSPLHAGYHLLTLRWTWDECFAPRRLRAISDHRPLET